MTAKRTKALYGSAPKKTCKKCDRKISCTNNSKHIKTRSEIRKKSWEKNRAKRVGFQRDQRAAKFVEELQDIRAGYGKQKERRLYPNQSRKGCQAIPSRCSAFIQASLSTRLPRNAPIIFIMQVSIGNAMMFYAEKHEFLSKKWFHALLVFLHPDKSHHLPQEWQNAQNYTAVRESFKLLPQYKEDMKEASTRTVYEERVRIEKYRLYLQTRPTFKDSV
ncbi:hypothetical protein PPTG_18751 [Phytophthora nicotianae INRA-310]|uniref:J domain-containing protein n=1 Tax=Phytophthora nicotianae (strain INRA-310) TaxID=761204 RepID=W2PFT1_PHYN3|nr:hypothetical protein PPTG_18751 [Phytophthora nicotianae INRA-310]ETM99500.1 hypothetical protein PPTG_18751 [Phytophthora nicotianae INRA-310]